MSRKVRVGAYNKKDGEHVRGYTKTVDGSGRRMDELPPEKPHEVEVEVHVSGHESHSREGKEEHVKPFTEKRKEKRFKGKSRELYEQVYREYRAKGYSKEEARRIAGGTVGNQYRKKLKESE